MWYAEMMPKRIAFACDYMLSLRGLPNKGEQRRPKINALLQDCRKEVIDGKDEKRSWFHQLFFIGLGGLPLEKVVEK